MIHPIQKMGYIRELQVAENIVSIEWQTDERAAGTTQGVAQLCIDIIVMSREDFALPVTVNDDQTSP
jgi:hypothetical protein